MINLLSDTFLLIFQIIQMIIMK